MFCLFQQLVVDNSVEVSYVVGSVIFDESKKVIHAFDRSARIRLDALSLYLILKDFKVSILKLFSGAHRIFILCSRPFLICLD